MNKSFQDVIAAAAEAAGSKPNPIDGSGRRPQLRAVDSYTPPPAPVAAPTPPSHGNTMFAMNGDLLGRGGLRLAFWLGGFYETALDRKRSGEVLSDREESLILLSAKDFAAIRPLVTGMALERLLDVIKAAEATLDDPGVDGPPGAIEMFGLETLRGLASRAAARLGTDGPDTALALFGDSAHAQTPLAVFQLVFSTALGLIEAFQRLVTTEARFMSRLVDTLGSEVERI